MIHLYSDYSSLNFQKLKNKSLLITGASGLIGINLLYSLKQIQKKYNIKIYVWIKNEYSIFESLYSDCTKIIGDITDYTIYENLPKFDYVIHSSGYGQPSKFLINKTKTIEINTTATIKLLNLLNKDGTFLFVSSSEVYNGLFKYEVSEDEIGNTDTQHPRAAYIQGKKCGEVICDAYREKGFNVKVARLSTAYGPGTKNGDKRVINTLIDKALLHEKIELMDNGDSLRTVCYISDAIEMLWNITLNGEGFIYNVGGIDTLTIRQIANKIGDIMKKIVILPMSNNALVGSPKIVNLSIDKYNKEFGVKKFVGIDDGLKNTIEWQKNIMDITNE
jgi:nucleoside-diphosphate-sugar epimerase